MGKNREKATPAPRHDPLDKQIMRDRFVERAIDPDAPTTTRKHTSHRSKLRDDELIVVPQKVQKAILKQAREQQEEIEQEEIDAHDDAPMRAAHASAPQSGAPLGFKFGARDDDDDDVAGDDDDDEAGFVEGDGDDQFYGGDEEFTEADEEAMRFFMQPRDQTLTIGDVIRQKIQSKQQDMGVQDHAPLEPKVLQVYQGVAQLLHRFRAGRLPKAFKIVPLLTNWEEILELTQPDAWSRQAVRAATRLFTSNLNVAMVARFFNLVLLPRIRSDIDENKKLNFHLFMALKKSLFKPQAFFKGILLPLAKDGTCTLREAAIISSVLGRASVPVLHSCAALMHLVQYDYNGSNSFFIKTLINKKYALPYRVIDVLVGYFMRFLLDHRPLPVLWHQTLLAFVQRCKNDMTREQQEAIRQLTYAKRHYQITPEVHRELNFASHREAEMLKQQQRLTTLPSTETLMTGSGSALDQLVQQFGAPDDAR